MKKVLFFALLLIAVSSMTFAESGKKSPIDDKTQPTTATNVAIVSPIMIPAGPSKPWVVATACGNETKYQAAYYFNTEGEAEAFAASWCTANDGGGCNWSIYVWLTFYPPFAPWTGAVLVSAGNCKTGETIHK